MYSSIKSSHRRITARLRSENAEILGHHPCSGVPKSDFLILSKEYQSYLASEFRIELFLPIEHPDLANFLDQCKHLGLSIPSDRFEVQPIEILDYKKASSEEIESSKYLECGLFKPMIRTPFSVTNEGQYTFINRSWLKQSSDTTFASVGHMPHLIAVRPSVKEKMETSKLVGLTFEPILGCDQGEPLWIIWSSFLLPPMDIQLVDNLGNRFESKNMDFGKLKSECYLCDQYEVYPRASYCDLPVDFDVGLSVERLGGLNMMYHRVIYSQKTKSILEEIGMSLESIPVRIG